jgi:hypothetical protein
LVSTIIHRGSSSLISLSNNITLSWLSKWRINMLMTLLECINDVTLIICISIKHMAYQNEQPAVASGIDAGAACNIIV